MGHPRDRDSTATAAPKLSPAPQDPISPRNRGIKTLWDFPSASQLVLVTYLRQSSVYPKGNSILNLFCSQKSFHETVP